MTDIMPTTAYAPDIIEECNARGVLRNQCAYVLATAQWETVHTMKPVREAFYLGEPEPAETHRKALRYYPWYGRGFVQLTWEDNYDRAQDELSLGTQLTDDPDKAMDPDIAKQIIVQGMLGGWFTGKKLEDYITLQVSDFYNARRIVNGTDRASEIAQLAHDYDAWLLEQGYGVETPPDQMPWLPDEWRERINAFARHIDHMEERIAELERWRAS